MKNPLKTYKINQHGLRVPVPIGKRCHIISSHVIPSHDLFSLWQHQPCLVGGHRIASNAHRSATQRSEPQYLSHDKFIRLSSLVLVGK
jgi:hypothetical protein